MYSANAPKACGSAFLPGLAAVGFDMFTLTRVSGRGRIDVASWATVRVLARGRDCSSSHSHFVGERRLASELGRAAQRGLADGADGLAREEGLMAGHDHVRERHQALQYVVGDDGAREVAEEQPAFL